MKTCPSCKVGLEDNMNFCPLCGEAQIDEGSDNYEYIELKRQVQEQKKLTTYQKLTGFQKRKLFWEISGIILISGIIVTLIIDLLANKDITWSRHPVTVCTVIFVNSTFFCFWIKRILLFLLGSFASTSALLILLDIFNGNIGWGVKLGIPLLLAAYLIIFILIVMIKNAKNKQLNIITYSLIASGLLCVCTEGIISLYSEKLLYLHWSLVVVACIVPVSSILMYIQYRLKKGTDLKRFFHI